MPGYRGNLPEKIRRDIEARLDETKKKLATIFYFNADGSSDSGFILLDFLPRVDELIEFDGNLCYLVYRVAFKCGEESVTPEGLPTIYCKQVDEGYGLEPEGD